MFELILFLAVIISGVIILVYKFFLTEQAKQDPEPVSLDYAKSFFPVLLIVFLLRGFVVEPFRIPSGSMLPTLEIGDFILVNKFSYGVRLPILHTKVLDVNEPKRGDVVVFRWPGDNETSYIKRLIGLPGDKIEYREKHLYINGIQVDSHYVGGYDGENDTNNDYLLFNDTVNTGDQSSQKAAFSRILKYKSYRGGVPESWVVPEGKYFMMGDNRDNSSDSREWGFLPEENIVGKAFFVWFHWDTSKGLSGSDISRIGSKITAEPVENTEGIESKEN